MTFILDVEECKRAVAWAKSKGLLSVRQAEPLPLRALVKDKPWSLKHRKTLAERLAQSRE